MLWKISLLAEKFLRETWKILTWNCFETTTILKNWLIEQSKDDLCTLLWNSVNMKYMNILIVIFALINAQEGKLMDSCLVFLNGKNEDMEYPPKRSLDIIPPISPCPLQCLSSMQFIWSSLQNVHILATIVLCIAYMIYIHVLIHFLNIYATILTKCSRTS